MQLKEIITPASNDPVTPEAEVLRPPLLQGKWTLPPDTDPTPRLTASGL